MQRGWETRRNRRRAERVNLRVLSSTTPTEAELQDREIVHTTAEPA